MKEREIAARRDGGAAKQRRSEWKVPRGGDMREITRDATGQVIDKYGEALRKLKDH